MTILSSTATARFQGRCTACNRPVSAILEDHTGKTATVTCPDCGAPCPGAQRLYAVETATHCNAACEGAIGPDCTCACGGINHGGVWAEEAEMIGPQLEAERARVAKAEARRVKARTARRTARQNGFTLWAATNLDAIEWLGRDANVAWSEFLSDMADIVEDGRELTDPQLDAVHGAMTRQAARDAQRAADTAAEAARPPATDPPIGAKKVTVTGTVTRVKAVESQFGTRHVMTVRVDDGGYQLQGTVPTDMLDTQRPDGEWGPRTGDRVTFPAGEIVATTWDAAPAHFAEYKRPRQGGSLIMDTTVAAVA